MKTQGVLLVNFNGEEVESVKNIFDQLKIDVTVFPVFNGRAALDMLMGSYGPSGVRPEIIMVSSRLPDMSSMELLGIIRKYYSLGNIRFYVLADAGETFDADPASPLKICGLLRRPLKAEKQTIELLGSLKNKPESHRMGWLGALALPSGVMKGVTFFKQQLTGVPAAFSGVTKAALCVSVAIIPGVAAIHSIKNEKQKLHAPPRIEVMRITPERPQTVSTPMSADEFTEPVEQPAPVIVEEKIIPPADTAAVEIPVQDTMVDLVKKTYRIGVKKVGDPE